jgi:hypothetical protein
MIDQILSKLDMIIEIQEKKMHIEIFGETSLDCGTIKKHLKCGRGVSEPMKISPPVVKQEEEASNDPEEQLSHHKK